MLGGHGREDHHQRGHLLAAPGAEALLLLGRLEVAQRLPALAHGQAGGLDVVLEQVGADRVARLAIGGPLPLEGRQLGPVLEHARVDDTRDRVVQLLAQPRVLACEVDERNRDPPRPAHARR